MGINFSLQLKDTLDRLVNNANSVLRERETQRTLQEALHLLMFYRNNYSRETLQEHLEIISGLPGVKIQGAELSFCGVKVEIHEDLRILMRENILKFAEEQKKKQKELLDKFWSRSMVARIYNDPQRPECVYIEIHLTTWAVFVESPEKGLLVTKSSDYGGFIETTQLPCDNNRLNELWYIALAYLSN